MNGQFEDWLPVICVGLFVVPIGLLIGYFVWINNCSDTREMRSIFFESKPYDIRSITIGADESSKKRTSLVAEAVTITDAKDIAEVMDALTTAVENNPPKGSVDWVAMLRVTHAKRTVTVEVICYQQDGVWLMFYSDGTSGWNLGTYGCRKLGPVLERLTGYVRKSERHDSSADANEAPASLTPEEK